MKIVVKKDALLTGLQMVNGIVATRTTLPILSNVLLRAEAGKLWMTTTDLEVTVRCCVEADVERKGIVTLPVRRLFSVTRELASDSVTIVVDEKSTAAMACGPSYFKILGLPADDFPVAPELAGHFSYSVERAMFREMLQRTFYAASTDEMRYILNGNLVSFRGGKLVTVATDGRRLAMEEREIEFPKEAERDAVIPTKVINELLHVMEGEGPMRIHLAPNQAAFEMPEASVTAKLIEGQFPNFRQVIPPQCDQRVTLERELLLDAVRRVAVLTSDKSTSVTLSFTKNQLQVRVSSPEVGEAHEELAVKYTGKDVSIAFNPEFVMAPLRTLTSDEILFDFTDDLSPGVMRSSEGTFVYVLMPMRIG